MCNFYEWKLTNKLRFSEEDIKKLRNNCNLREILLADITYFIYKEKQAYLSTIKDAKTNEILSYALSESLEMNMIEETIKSLIKHY